jgi:5'-nucleotidase
MRATLHRLVTIVILLCLSPVPIGPALAATTCAGSVLIGEGPEQVTTGVANTAFQGRCLNAWIVDTAAEGANYGSQAEFVAHLGKLSLAWTKAQLITPQEAAELLAAGLRSHVGRMISVRVIAFNDFHGNLQSPGTFGAQAGGPGTPVVNQPAGGVDYLAGYVAAQKVGHPNNVVVSAGDLIGPAR